MPEEVVHKREHEAVEVKSIEDLARKVRSYSRGADLEFLKRAYWFSSEAHGMQTRKEGTPYMEHPLAVASILADMKMDTTTIAAAIMHDTIEDTHITVEDIRKRFGYELAFLVDGLTKLSRMEFKSKELAQAENFRKMFLSMAEDIRVVLIKFADRLHNMRTLQFLPESKRQRIAAETLDIYAPLANRLGIGWMKTEFEDASFRYLMPRLYKEISDSVTAKREEHEKYINNVIQIIEKRLKGENLPGKVTGRVKHYYGIYQKMQNQGIPLEQIHDILGLRIITDTKANCYAILGLVHSLWKPIPGKFKDYIGVPKPNMYRSLHTTVIGPGGERVEFQIRTREMHHIAEEGIAAHWKYKEKDGSRHKDDRYISWLRDLVQAQKEMPDARAFLEAVKAEVVPDIVYVFTPQGDIKELPAGSTPVDFAYAIHTEVGHKCVGARVNGKMVPLRHQLESGNTVEIITSQSHKPSRDWLKFVVTQRAKSRIKQWLKTEERKQSIALGTKLLEEELRRRHLSPSVLKSDDMAKVAESYNMPTVEDLLVSVGYGKISHHQVVNRLRPEAAALEEEAKPRKAARKPKEHKGITIKGVDDVLYHTAKCCFPVPGDDLVGFITRGKGVAVHRADCLNLERLAVDEARLVEVEWEPEADTVSHARLVVETVDKPGMLANLSSLISAADVNISHLEANSTQEKTARIIFILEVRDKSQLKTIVRNIMQTEGVLNVKRY
ncbi:MAG: bifunctional (p)ppGpp synthetase/guanosine-3',5'-bis(diphosphate) 3'-pyrophosphohydrolase [Thermodesulfovibrionales bacterium]